MLRCVLRLRGERVSGLIGEGFRILVESDLLPELWIFLQLLKDKKKLLPVITSLYHARLFFFSFL
jgi:hypothetical protein